MDTEGRNNMATRSELRAWAERRGWKVDRWGSYRKTIIHPDRQWLHRLSFYPRYAQHTVEHPAWGWMVIARTAYSKIKIEGSSIVNLGITPKTKERPACAKAKWFLRKPVVLCW